MWHYEQDASLGGCFGFFCVMWLWVSCLLLCIERQACMTFAWHVVACLSLGSFGTVCNIWPGHPTLEPSLASTLLAALNSFNVEAAKAAFELVLSPAFLEHVCRAIQGEG